MMKMIKRGQRREEQQGGEADDEDRDGDRNRGRGEKMKKEDGGVLMVVRCSGDSGGGCFQRPRKDGDEHSS